MRTKFKPWAKPYLDEHKEVQVEKVDYSSLKDIELEIGSGKGSFLIKKATNNPNTHFVGIEKNLTCAGITCKALVESKLTNAKIIFDDAINVAPLLKEKSVNNIYLNFSDPWPKKRHHKRRLTTDKFLNEYYRILKDTGEIIFKTDNRELFEFSLEMFTNNKFVISYVSFNYEQVEQGDEITEYEASFRENNESIYRLKAKKVI